MSDKELTARQYSVKAIHEDNLNLRNPSILAKLLKDYASIKCKELRDMGEKRIVQLLWFYTDNDNGLNADNTINEVLEAFKKNNQTR